MGRQEEVYCSIEIKLHLLCIPVHACWLMLVAGTRDRKTSKEEDSDQITDLLATLFGAHCSVSLFPSISEKLLFIEYLIVRWSQWRTVA